MTADDYIRWYHKNIVEPSTIRKDYNTLATNIAGEPMFGNLEYRRSTTKPYQVYIEEEGQKMLSKPASALAVQVGGNHYKEMVIQPVEFIMANKLGFCEGNAIKYICRYRTKNGIEDLKKAKHYIEMLIEQEEKDGKYGNS